MDVQQVALSGGTFLNRILLQEVLSGLREAGLEVYINEKVPCGDGGIALGQMYLATYQKET
jgi:hydrogenase maturation protein HypF